MHPCVISSVGHLSAVVDFFISWPAEKFFCVFTVQSYSSCDSFTVFLSMVLKYCQIQADEEDVKKWDKNFCKDEMWVDLLQAAEDLNITSLYDALILTPVNDL